MTSTSQRNGQTILELAMSSKNVSSDMVPVERTLLVIGSKNAGKTSLIHSFFDKNEKPKPTLALEYSFARRSGKSLDKKFLSPLPLPLMIVGSKYDVYQNFEPAKKRVLCQCLRYVAHTYGASLIFYGVNDAVLMKISKEMMSHYGFGTPYPKNHIYDSNKPLLVPAGSDCFDKIDNVNEVGSISDEELIIIALMLDEEQENNCKTIKKRKRTVWVHDLWKKRQTEGEFTIYNGLIDDEQKFYEYFRMSQYSFNVLHGKIEILRIT
ncbi:hypothetical protein QTP88_004152 [Uroleucon formosanum]